MRREDALRVAEECTRALRDQFGAKKVHVCRSAARESPWHSRSDLDLVVEGLPAERYFEALAALWDLLPEGLDLDLLRLETAPPGLVRRLTGGEKMPEDPREALAQQIREELENLSRLVEQGNTFLRQETRGPTPVEIMGAGKIIHDFYTGVERIFERVAVGIDEDLPSGPHWHTDLLRRMENPWLGKRGAVVNHEVALRLHRYMRFRHLFRHTYGYELSWDELRPLVEFLPQVHADVRFHLERFLSGLGSMLFT